jgi:phosphoribosylformimino-5-aminoimidazole carboxamide ribotide isomerase
VIVFPAIDLRQGRCVRLRQGQSEDEILYGDDPAAVARRWVQQGAQWLHVVNLDGAFGDAAIGPRGPINLQRLEEIHASAPDIPIQFGGGLRSLDDVEEALGRGATRVILGTVAVQEPELVAEALVRFGVERIAVGIDAHDGRVATHGWTQTSDTTALALGQQVRAQGAIRAVYTDIARDGMLSGVNVEATAALARASGLRVIASGGVASLQDIRRLKAAGEDKIEGVIVGQALYSGAVSLGEAIRAAAGELGSFSESGAPARPRRRPGIDRWRPGARGRGRPGRPAR